MNQVYWALFSTNYISVARNIFAAYLLTRLYCAMLVCLSHFLSFACCCFQFSISLPLLIVLHPPVFNRHIVAWTPQKWIKNHVTLATSYLLVRFLLYRIKLLLVLFFSLQFLFSFFSFFSYAIYNFVLYAFRIFQLNWRADLLSSTLIISA